MEKSIIRAAVFTIAAATQFTGCVCPPYGEYDSGYRYPYYGRSYYRPPEYFRPRRDDFGRPAIIERRYPSYVVRPDMYYPDRPPAVRLNPPTHNTSQWMGYPSHNNPPLEGRAYQPSGNGYAMRPNPVSPPASALDNMPLPPERANRAVAQRGNFAEPARGILP
ncbi:MAG: hypothetical protein WCH98_04455 [Verrucomicrobiota bacterium]